MTYMVNKKDETFIAVTVSKIDFENFEDYNNATPEKQEKIWKFAQKRVQDMLLQDYELCVQCCIDSELDPKWY